MDARTGWTLAILVAGQTMWPEGMGWVRTAEEPHQRLGVKSGRARAGLASARAPGGKWAPCPWKHLVPGGCFGSEIPSGGVRPQTCLLTTLEGHSPWLGCCHVCEM